MKTILIILFIVFVISLIWYIVTTPTYRSELEKVKQRQGNPHKPDAWLNSDSSSNTGDD